MEPELRLDRGLGVFALLQREGGVFEFLDHAALAEIAEVAAFRLVRVGRLGLGKLGEILAGIEVLDDRLGFVLGLDEDVPGMNFFLRRDLLDLGVIARLDLVVGHGVDDILAEIGIVQFALTQEGKTLLELVGVFDAVGLGDLGNRFHVDGSRQSGQLLLVVRKLCELRVEIGNTEIDIRLVDFLIANLGDNRIGAIGGIGRTGQSECGNDSRDKHFLTIEHVQTFQDPGADGDQRPCKEVTATGMWLIDSVQRPPAGNADAAAEDRASPEPRPGLPLLKGRQSSAKHLKMKDFLPLRQAFAQFASQRTVKTRKPLARKGR